MEIGFNELFNNSYEAIHANPEHFYKLFYKNFLASSDEISRIFEQKNMDNQPRILKSTGWYN